MSIGSAPPAFRAAYDSEDSCCGEGIEQGQQIRSDGSGGYEHVTCPLSATPMRHLAPKCPRCFCHHPGEC